jgi:hypothetical protein
MPEYLKLEFIKVRFRFVTYSKTCELQRYEIRTPLLVPSSFS